MWWDTITKKNNKKLNKQNMWSSNENTDARIKFKRTLSKRTLAQVLCSKQICVNCGTALVSHR